jgi:microsomal dipeptidase-like Zn-dependent dipeptidase
MEYLKTENTGTLELHAHLFMKHGMGWMHKGSFKSVKAKNWRDRFSSQADANALERSGNTIVVVALYAHPLFTRNQREAIRAQLAEAANFVNEHSNWIIAKSPEEAEKGLQTGKKILILSLEGAAGVLETNSDMEEFIDRGGIRIVTPLHLTDDEFGGVATLGGFFILASPLKWLRGEHLNKKGLTERGRWLVKTLAERKIWIDLSHASDASHAEIAAILAKHKQPLLHTHTSLRRFKQSERAISESQLQEIAASGGMIGLIPSTEMLGKPPGFATLSASFDEAVKVLGEDGVTIGSDLNSGLKRLPPHQLLGDKLKNSGFSDIGHTAELWKALKRTGTSPVARFLGAWKKVRPQASES